MGKVILKTSNSLYQDAIDVLMTSESFRRGLVSVGDVRISAKIVPLLRSPFTSNIGTDGIWTANIDPSRGALFNGRLVTLPELIAHEVAHGLPSIRALRADRWSGVTGKGEKESEAATVKFVNAVRDDLNLPPRFNVSPKISKDVVNYVRYLSYCYQSSNKQTSLGYSYYGASHIIFPGDDNFGLAGSDMSKVSGYNAYVQGARLEGFTPSQIAVGMSQGAIQENGPQSLNIPSSLTESFRLKDQVDSSGHNQISLKLNLADWLKTDNAFGTNWEIPTPFAKIFEESEVLEVEPKPSSDDALSLQMIKLYKEILDALPSPAAAPNIGAMPDPHIVPVDTDLMPEMQ